MSIRHGNGIGGTMASVDDAYKEWNRERQRLYMRSYNQKESYKKYMREYMRKYRAKLKEKSNDGIQCEDQSQHAVT